MSQSVTINLLSEHIKEGRRYSPKNPDCLIGNCPGAIAVLDAIPNAHRVTVGCAWVIIKVPSTDPLEILETFSVRIPEPLRGFVERYDSRNEDFPETVPAPLSFVLEVPDAVLGEVKP